MSARREARGANPVRSRLTRMRRDEDGIALVMVISFGSVVAILLVAAIALSMSAIRGARNDESWSGALAAAYAGVEEYQSLLAGDPTYLRFGNPAAAYSATSSLVAPPVANPAFGVGAVGTWASVAGSEGTASYRYEVDSSTYAATGTISLRSTGRVGSETRTVVADLRQSGFIDFLYFTDFEIQDPALSGARDPECLLRAWAGRTQGDNCSEISFGTTDVLNGPVHSNDTIRACGSTFKKAVTTAWNSAPYFRQVNSNGAGCGNSTFELAGFPSYSPVIGMPATNAELKRETRSDLTGVDVPVPGCLYTGPTDIRFNNDGTMTVRSPWTRMTQTSGSTASAGSVASYCGTPGITGMASAAGSTFPVPANNVIYVQPVTTVSSDVNSWAVGTFPRTTFPTGVEHNLVCEGADAQANGNGIGYPTTGENVYSSTAYDCRAGDVFIDGELRGAVTVAADKYIYITGDLTYGTSSATNMLGLIGNNAIFVWNPLQGNDSLLASSGRTINAAMLSLEHTFQVQNYNRGDNQGTLHITGAIAQKYRGIVRTTGSSPTGYAKDYVYDERLKYTAPPKYLSPVNTTYRVTRWIEVQSAFDSAGGPL